MFAVTALLFAQGVHGHGWSKNSGCSPVSSCGRRRHEPTFGRHFDYHRRHLAKQDAMDVILAKIANKFDTLNDHVNRNTLIRQQGRRDSFREEPWDLPYSVEDYGEVGMKLSVKVPGVRKEDISVEFEEKTNRLVVSGRRFRREKGFVSQSEFSQSFGLDDDIDVDGIEVMLQSGILIVSLPRKRSMVTEKRIKIPITFIDGTDESNNAIQQSETSKVDQVPDKQEIKTKSKEDRIEASDVSEKEVEHDDPTPLKERWDDDFLIFEDDPDDWV
jgi:HSP20 family molecular chaperone IbpA